MVLVSKLDDGNISSIGRVLEIKAKEIVFILVMPSLQIGKKTRDPSAVVRVGDIEKGLAWCCHISKLNTNSIHGGGLGKKRGEQEEESPYPYCSKCLSVSPPDQLEQLPKRAGGKRFVLFSRGPYYDPGLKVSRQANSCQANGSDF